MSDEIIKVTIHKHKRIPNIYRPPLGLPLNWRDETSGELPRVVFKYFNSQYLTTNQIALLAEYCRHYINAPCWDATGGFPDELAVLRQSANLLSSVREISQWINDCLEIAMTLFKRIKKQLTDAYRPVIQPKKKRQEPLVKLNYLSFMTTILAFFRG